VAASAHDNAVADLQVGDETAAWFVPGDDSQVADSAAVLTELLTVWRRLHVKFDQMPRGRNSDNVVLDFVAAVNAYDATNNSTELSIPRPHSDFAEDDHFQGGHAKIGLTWTDVISYHASLGNHEVVVAGDFRGADDKIFALYDDDMEKAGRVVLYKSKLPYELPTLWASAGLEEAYVLLEPNFETSTRDLWFDRNLNSADERGDLINADRQYLPSDISVDYLTATVVSSFQGQASHDGSTLNDADPNVGPRSAGATLGITQTAGETGENGVHVFLEVLREQGGGWGLSAFNMAVEETVQHELGHILIGKTDHDVNPVVVNRGDGDVFTDNYTLETIRGIRDLSYIRSNY